MPSVLEILNKTEEYFREKKVPNAKGDARSLIAQVLGCSKPLDLYLQYDRLLKEPELEQLRSLVRRRGNREPLQYLLEIADFYDLKLEVSASVLIPRPETEELVEYIRSELDKVGWRPGAILDIGTGSGAIALALAKTFPQANVKGVDIEEACLATAFNNAQRNGISNVNFSHGNLFEGLETGYDLIVSNPPYLSPQEWHATEPEIQGYEPYTALVAEPDGLSVLTNILQNAQTYLREGGYLFLEIGCSQREAVWTLAEKNGWEPLECKNDLDGHPRFFKLVLFNR